MHVVAVAIATMGLLAGSVVIGPPASAQEQADLFCIRTSKAVTPGALSRQIAKDKLDIEVVPLARCLPAEQDPMASGMVTGTVAARQTSGGNETSDGEVYRSEGVKYVATWDASDPRLSGEENYTGNWHSYSDDFQVETNTRVVVNDEGRWVGTGTALAGSGMNAETAVLHGEGAYEGLTAYLVLDAEPDPVTFVGAIFPGEMPAALEPTGNDKPTPGE